MENFDQETKALVKQLEGSDYQLLIGSIGIPGGTVTNYAAIIRHKDDADAQGSSKTEVERQEVYSKSIRFDTTNRERLVELIKSEYATLGIPA